MNVAQCQCSGASFQMPAEAGASAQRCRQSKWLWMLAAMQIDETLEIGLLPAVVLFRLLTLVKLPR